MTGVISKQLQPIYDKPMVYYPLNTLMLAGIRDILVISTPRDVTLFEQLLGDGSRLGISLRYAVQPQPNGIAEALIIAERVWGSAPVTLILGDNLFHGQSALFRTAVSSNTGATIFGYHVHNPSRYGVVDIDANGRITSIEEKPKQPKSHLAIPGLYIYDERASTIAQGLVRSARGELEITDVHNAYLAEGGLRVLTMDRSTIWMDTGTPESLLEAANYIHAIERRQGRKVACIEETALRMNFLTHDEYLASVAQLPHSSYRSYCMELVEQ